MKNKLIELAKSEDISLEIYERGSKRTDINTLNGKLNLFQINNITTYNIKALINGKMVSLITESIRKPKEIIAELKTIYEIQENDNSNRLCQGNYQKREEIAKIDYNKVKQDFLNLDNLRKEFPLITDIQTSYSHYNNLYSITNNDCDLVDSNCFNEYGAAISVKKDNITKVVYISYYTKDYDFTKFRDYLKEKINNLIIKLDSKSCVTNKYKIILMGNVVSDLLEHFAEHFDSRGIYLKSSLLVDKLNTKIFSDKISIIEDAPKGIAARAFDTEGTMTGYQEIVVDGVFKKEINNLEYALKLKKEATGNAYGVNNLYIKAGDKSIKELISLLDNGIIIDEAYGLHSGIDDSTGVISLQAEGLLVEDGKIVRGMNNIVLSTNFFEIFSNVIAVGNEVKETNCSVLAPSLLLKDISIAGSDE